MKRPFEITEVVFVVLLTSVWVFVREWRLVPCGDFTVMVVSCPEGCCLTSPQVSAAVFISQSLYLSPCLQPCLYSPEHSAAQTNLCCESAKTICIKFKSKEQLENKSLSRKLWPFWVIVRVLLGRCKWRLVIVFMMAASGVSWLFLGSSG